MNEVHLNLLGFVADQEQITGVAADFTSTALTFTVADATQISTGLIEVDEELMWCTLIDPDTKVVTVSTRGVYGTTAAAHTAATSVVRNNPRWPRFSIARALNDTIRGVFPDLFAVTKTTLSSVSATITYALPAAAEQVLDVTVDEASVSGYWSPVRRYQVDMHANSTTFPTGKTISILEGLSSGRTVNVTYTYVPTTLAALAAELTTSGLAESAKETLVYGACARLVGYTEPARMSDSTAEARFMGTQTQGAALGASRYFYQMHLQARAEEVRRLQHRYPPRIHWTR